MKDREARIEIEYLKRRIDDLEEQLGNSTNLQALRSNYFSSLDRIPIKDVIRLLLNHLKLKVIVVPETLSYTRLVSEQDEKKSVS